MLEVAGEGAECEPPGPRDLDTPPPDVPGLDGVGDFGRDGVGSDGFGSDGAGTVGVATVGVGSDGVLTVGTGTGRRTVGVVAGVEGTGSRTVGVVTGGVTGVEGTVTDGRVSAASAWPTRGGAASRVRTSASRASPMPHNVPRRSQPPDSWPLRVARCLPLIALDIYPTLRKSNRGQRRRSGAPWLWTRRCSEVRRALGEPI